MRLRTMARRLLTATPIPGTVLRYRARRHLTVLGYHRILPTPSADFPFNEGVISATPEDFSRQLKYLKANMDVISIPQLLAGLNRESLLPERPAVITFDDGYVDNHAFALPLLKEHRLPACFFICTGIVGTGIIPWYEAWVCCLKRSRASRIESPFDKNEEAYDLSPGRRHDSIRRFRKHMRVAPWKDVPRYMERLRELTGVTPAVEAGERLFMSWDHVRELADAGMDIGGHTRTHPNLRQVDDAAVLRDQVSGCFEDLRVQLGRKPVAFAYPFGQADFMSDRADEEIVRAGFEISFSFDNGLASRQPGALRRLPRVHVISGDSRQDFALRIATAPRRMN